MSWKHTCAASQCADRARRRLLFAALLMIVASGSAHGETSTSGAGGCLCQTIEDPRSPLFTVRSNEPRGDSGQQRISPNFGSRCENVVLPFSHAELITKRARFGRATITQMPKPGCTECPPIEVQWLHEPTGHLEAELRVYRQIRHLSCCPG